MPVLTDVTILRRPLTFMAPGMLAHTPDAWLLLKDDKLVDVWIPFVRAGEVINGGV